MDFITMFSFTVFLVLVPFVQTGIHCLGAWAGDLIQADVKIDPLVMPGSTGFLDRRTFGLPSSRPVGALALSLRFGTLGCSMNCLPGLT